MGSFGRRCWLYYYWNIKKPLEDWMRNTFIEAYEIRTKLGMPTYILKLREAILIKYLGRWFT